MDEPLTSSLADQGHPDLADSLPQVLVGPGAQDKRADQTDRPGQAVATSCPQAPVGHRSGWPPGYLGSKCEVGGLPGKLGGGTAEQEQRVGTRPPRRDAEPSEPRDSRRARPGPSDSCRRERVNGGGELGWGSTGEGVKGELGWGQWNKGGGETGPVDGVMVSGAPLAFGARNRAESHRAESGGVKRVLSTEDAGAGQEKGRHGGHGEEGLGQGR